MTLEDWLTRIDGGHPVKWDLGLQRIGRVAEAMGLLSQSGKVVLVAGTNGKGSACEYLDHLARASGMTTGKSTSPHFHRFNERIAVNGEPAGDQEIIEAFSAIDECRGDISLTYFEYAALASLFIFREQAVDLSILEIGLGGRLDAMNIVTPDVSLITAIALDHEAWLGCSREQIAREKAGITRRGVPCVVADREPPTSFITLADQGPTRYINKDFDIEEQGTDRSGDAEYRAWWHQPDRQASRTVPGDVPPEVRHAPGIVPESGRRCVVDRLPPLQLPADSFVAALQVAAELGMNLRDRDIRRAAGSASLPGRRQWVRRQQRDMLLDVAHNPAAAKSLADYIKTCKKTGQDGQVHALVGIYADKDIHGILASMAGVVDQWHCCDFVDPRAESAENICRMLAGDFHSRGATYANIGIALKVVLAKSDPADTLLVFGSFPLVAGAQRYLIDIG